MHVRWAQVEPEIAGRVREAFQENERRVHAAAPPAARVRLESGWAALSLTGSLLLVGLYAGLCFRSGAGAGPILLAAFFGLPVVLVLLLLADRFAPFAPLRSADLERALASAPLSETQRLYTSVLRLALDAPLGARDGRVLLSHLRALVGQESTLALIQERLTAALAPGAIDRLGGDVTRLRARLAATDDAFVHDALARSLDLLAERADHTQALPALLDRISARRELIVQTLETLHLALLRVQAAPLAASAAEIGALRESVRALASRARAIEEASGSLESRLP